MERTTTCPHCNQEVTYTDKDIIKKCEFEKPVGFCRILNVYWDVLVKCPNCGKSFIEKDIYMNDVIYHGNAHHTPKPRVPLTED